MTLTNANYILKTIFCNSHMMKVLVLLIIFSVGDAANILGVFNHPAKSHTFLGTVLFEELARRGHNVTFMNGYQGKSTTRNYKNVVIEGIADDLLAREMIYFDHKSNQHQIIKESIKMSLLHMEATFENLELKKMISTNQSFDLIISDFFYNDANLVLGHIFKAPMIVLSSFGNTLATWHLTGNDLPFSYVPGCSLQLSDNMDFWERLQMTISGSNLLWTLTGSKRSHLELMKKYFDDVPSMEELYENVALVLVNSHYSFETVRPSTPNVVPIGGFHIQKPKTLSKDLKKLMDEADNGIIFFSLGSQIKTSNMKNETIVTIVEAFGKLNKLVLWKFEKNINISLPNNVIIKEWFSQTDILAHPNLRLFMTHGGSLSMIEAIHYGVSMIAIPFNGDQHMNGKFIETRKIGKLVNLEDISRETFGPALNEVMDNPIFKRNAQHHSNLLRNQPVKPLDTAMFWIEHVIEQKGAPLLKPFSTKLSWSEYHLLDVYSLIFGVLFSVISTVLFVVNYGIYVILLKLGYFRNFVKVKRL